MAFCINLKVFVCMVYFIHLKSSKIVLRSCVLFCIDEGNSLTVSEVFGATNIS